MTLSELQAERRAKVTEARALYRTLTDKTPEKEARKIEREFDVLMAEVDDLAAQIDEAKDQSEAEEARMAKRPGVNPGTVRTGGEEEPVEVCHRNRSRSPHGRLGASRVPSGRGNLSRP